MAVLVTGQLLGPLGLVVALPILAVVMVVVRRILINRIYEGQGFRKASREQKLVLRVPVPDGGVLLAEGEPVDILAFKTRVSAPAPGVPPNASAGGFARVLSFRRCPSSASTTR